MKIPHLAVIATLILAATQISCTPMIENGRDHRHDEKFRTKNESRDSDE